MQELLTQAVGGVATVTNTWSANGALATSTTPTGTRTYVTDLTDELISLTLEDATTVDYTHDASGNRTSRSIDGVLDASWAWDDLSALPVRIGEYDPTGTLATSWLADPTSTTGASLAQTTNGVSSWLLSDPFANTVATVATTGDTVSGTRTMNAFGVERTRATGALADAAVGFAGQYLDEATGLYDMRACDYDPTSGRFTATDPVAVPTGMPYVAGYTYAYNNPLMFSDASGLTPRLWDPAPGTNLGIVLLRPIIQAIIQAAAGCWGQNAAAGSSASSPSPSPTPAASPLGTNLGHGIVVNPYVPQSIVDVLLLPQPERDWPRIRDYVHEVNAEYEILSAYAGNDYKLKKEINWQAYMMETVPSDYDDLEHWVDLYRVHSDLYDDLYAVHGITDFLAICTAGAYLYCDAITNPASITHINHEMGD